VALVASLSVASCFGQFHPWLDLLSHFKLVYIALLLVLLVGLLFLRCHKAGAITFALLLLTSRPVFSMYCPLVKSVRNDEGKLVFGLPQVRMRILQINPQADKNHQVSAAIGYIRELQPEVFVVTELSDQWKNSLAAEFGDYPYRVVASKHTSGIALFSKYPVLEQEVVYFPGDPVEHPQIRCRLKTIAGDIKCIVAHPTVPKKMVASRNAELLGIGETAARAGSRCLVLGDLNCSPWSYYFTRMLEVGKLSDSEQGFGPQPSWSTEFLIPFVPIDHFLVSRDVVVLNRVVGPKIGSDHLPLYVDLLVRSLVTKP
jgi:endonuclease/exonuclease/phosphatase (EEP) superfamily protein YafD